MVSSAPVPWYDQPARPFPALVWLKGCYPFYIPPALFARYAPAGRAPAQRPFPAKLWRDGQQRASHPSTAALFTPSSAPAPMRTQHVRIAGYNGNRATRDR